MPCSPGGWLEGQVQHIFRERRREIVLALEDRLDRLAELRSRGALEEISEGPELEGFGRIGGAGMHGEEHPADQISKAASSQISQQACDFESQSDANHIQTILPGTAPTVTGHIVNPPITDGPETSTESRFAEASQQVKLRSVFFPGD